jgi:hypothetical protein
MRQSGGNASRCVGAFASQAKLAREPSNVWHRNKIGWKCDERLGQFLRDNYLESRFVEYRESHFQRILQNKCRSKSMASLELRLSHIV